MQRRKLILQPGFTVIELAVTIVASIIVVVGIAVVLVDSQRGWNRMYNRTYSDIVVDSYVARKFFDTEVRKASRERFLVDDAGTWVEVYYYADDSSTAVDRYTRFFESGGDLNVEYGKLDPRETLSVQTVCSNVSNCTFKRAGRSVQMILTLDNGSQSITTVSSAVMHNE